MKHTIKILILFFLLACIISHAQDSSKTFFSNSRSITYSLHYGFINAGTLECRSDTNMHLVEGYKCYKMDVLGQTSGAAASFAKIHDKWITYIDRKTGLPIKFIRELQENKYVKEELTEFDRQNNIALVSTKTNDDEYSVTSHVISSKAHDMVSAYLALNAAPLDTMKTNQTLQFDVFLEDSTYTFQIKFLGKESINTAYGKKDAYKLSPVMPENSVFSKEEDIVCWISADKDKIPLKVRAKIAIGSIEMELDRYSGY